MKHLHHRRSSVCNIHYHIVWSVKYRRPILDEEVADCLKKVLNEAAVNHGFTLDLCEVGSRDPVHVFVSAPPTLTISTVVKVLKGVSSRRLFAVFPGLKRYLWGGHLWNPSYFVETVGSVSEQNIRRYIENQ